MFLRAPGALILFGAVLSGCSSPAVTTIGEAQAATPSFSVAPGTYVTSQSVAISDATPGAAIYYTTNGAVPTTTSALYDGPITVASTETLQAIASASGFSQSAVAAARYTITQSIAPQAATPSFNVAPGTYVTSQSVAISDATPGAAIHYTTNGAVPTTTSALYSGPITVASTETLQAIASASGFTQSAVAAARYTITPPAATPSFSVAPGAYVGSQTVAISDATPGAVIYYTTNGAVPTSASALYNGPITILSSVTLQAIAIASGYSRSPVAAAQYSITPLAAAPSFSLASGSYLGSQIVAISDATPGAAIYYTTDGSAPTTASALYNGAVTVSSSEALKAIAIASGYSQSLVATARYSIIVPSIYEENLNPGTKDWKIAHFAKGQIEGFPSSPSVPQGGTIDFMVNTASPQFILQVFRLGWYGGLGGRAMTSPQTLPGTPQPSPLFDPNTGLIECPWTSSYSLQIPTSWMSGIYLAKLTTSDTGVEAYIVFVVTNPESSSKLLYDVPLFTYQAYNQWGGKSLYNGSDGQRGYKVSLRRPYDNGYGAGLLFEFDIDDIRFLEKHGYDVSYETDLDLHLSAIDLTRHMAWVVMAHPEYWSRPMRDAVTSARDAGIHLGFFSANEMTWQVRVETSPFTGVPNSTIVCYKSALLDPDAQDPSTENLTTTEWRKPPVNEPEELVTGASYDEGLVSGTADLVVADGSSWVFAGTGLSTGAHIANLIADETNEVHGWGPPNTITVAHSPVILQAGPATPQRFSDMTWYQANSGAIVFEASTLHLGWGLEPFTASHNLADPNANAAVQQIVGNVLARFGAQPVN